MIDYDFTISQIAQKCYNVLTTFEKYVLKKFT